MKSPRHEEQTPSVVIESRGLRPDVPSAELACTSQLHMHCGNGYMVVASSLGYCTSKGAGSFVHCHAFGGHGHALS